MYTCLKPKDIGVSLCKANTHPIIRSQMKVCLDAFHPGQFALVRPFAGWTFVTPGLRIIPLQHYSVTAREYTEHQLTVQRPLQRSCTTGGNRGTSCDSRAEFKPGVPISELETPLTNSAFSG